jgi:beta-glucanase (GH16 family)
MKKLFSLISAVLFLAATSVLAAPPAGYNLVWSDEFDGTSLDANNWTNDVGTGYNGWGNGEKEYYTDGDNLEFGNGAVTMVAKLESMGGMDYTSARFTSQGKKFFTYGYIECKMKAASGKGLWNAVWMLGEDFQNDNVPGTSTPWPACGEVEIYESRTGQQQYSNCAGDNYFIGTCHYAANGTGPASFHSQGYCNAECLCKGYHLYAVQWDETKFQYFFDGQKYWEYPITASYLTCFHQDMFMLFNMAVGGNYQGNQIDASTFPARMYVDYIRWYQLGAGVEKNVAKQGVHRSFTLESPASAQLRVYNINGRLVADLTGKVRAMRAGDNALTAVPASLTTGAYIARFVDNGKALSQRLVSAR